MKKLNQKELYELLGGAVSTFINPSTKVFPNGLYAGIVSPILLDKIEKRNT